MGQKVRIFIILLIVTTIQVHADRGNGPIINGQEQNINEEDTREGFLFSLGVGAHTSLFSYEYDDSYGEEITNSGFSTLFKLGYGFSEQWTLYYVNNVSWYDAAKSIQGITGIGTTYYIHPKSESFYVNGAIGAGTLVDRYRGTHRGTSYLMGMGYEFSSHYQVELNFFFGEVGDIYDTSSLMLTVNYLWY